ncbi:MAG: hypothetical protein KDA55_17380, partial [Planctomycetales bacterium]|nr:hypothetical protein [Planctomycetales bacterium]
DSNTRTGVEFGKRMRSRRAQGSQFVVNYNGFSSQARTAFQAAVDIWESLLQSDVPIRVHANWRPLDPGVLGSAGPATYSRNFAGAPLTNTWYPIALANRIAGSDLAPNSVDINCNFSSVFNNWYFGTDGNPPVNQYDLMSVVLHELGHGLGFTGTMTTELEAGAAAQLSPWPTTDLGSTALGSNSSVQACFPIPQLPSANN